MKDEDEEVKKDVAEILAANVVSKFDTDWAYRLGVELGQDIRKKTIDEQVRIIKSMIRRRRR